jgi:DNA-directed RNA polymerase specialized sigma24 family protein
MKKIDWLFPDVRHFDQPTLRAQVLAGDPEAFGELMRRYEPLVRQEMLRALTGSMLTSSDTLEEVLAEFWVALLGDRMGRLRTWGPDRDLGAWLRLLAWQTSMSHLRALSRHARVLHALRSI